jgi:hypothetical protein
MTKKRVASLFALIALLVLLPAALQAQFARTYGGRSADNGAWIMASPDNGFLVCSASASFSGIGPWLLKLTADGTVAWEKAYIPGSGSAYMTAACPAADGGYALLGTAWVIRTNALGEPVWQASLSFPDFPNVLNLHTICPGPESGFYIVGYTGTYQIPDLWIARLSSEGDLVWQKTYDLGGDERGGGAASFDGGLAVACTQWDEMGTNGKCCFLEIDALGAVTRQTALTSSNVMVTEVRALRTAPGGGYLAAGSEFVLKLAEDGLVEWAKVYPGAYLSDLRPTSDGGSIVTGTYGSDLLVMKLGPAGDIEWQKAYGGYFGETGTSVVEAAAGDYAACGTTSSFGAGLEDLCVLRIPEGGEIGACGFSRGAAIWATAGEVVAAATGVTAADTAATVSAGDFAVSNTTGYSRTFRLCTVSKLLTISSNITNAIESWTSPTIGTHVYLPGGTVTLSAAASATWGGTTYNFSSWDGDVVTVSNPTTVVMNDDLSVRVNYYEEWPDPDDPPHSIDECFVATAAYRTPLHPAVKLLREFRDKRLLTNGAGRAFVAAYYRWSPGAARVVAGSGILRLAARALLIPVIALAAVVLKLGWIPSFLLLAALAVAARKLRTKLRTRPAEAP